MPIEILNSGVDLSGDVDVTARTERGIVARREKMDRTSTAEKASRPNTRRMGQRKQRPQSNPQSAPYEPIGSMESVFNLKVLKVARGKKGEKLNKKKQIKLKNRNQASSGGLWEKQQQQRTAAAPAGPGASQTQLGGGSGAPGGGGGGGGGDGGGKEDGEAGPADAVPELDRHLGEMMRQSAAAKAAARGRSGGYGLVRARLAEGDARVQSLRARGALAGFCARALDPRDAARWGVADARRRGHAQEFLFERPSIDNYARRAPPGGGGGGGGSGGGAAGRPTLGSRREKKEEEGYGFGQAGSRVKLSVYQNKLNEKLEEYEARRAAEEEAAAAAAAAAAEADPPHYYRAGSPADSQLYHPRPPAGGAHHPRSSLAAAGGRAGRHVAASPGAGGRRSPDTHPAGGNNRPSRVGFHLPPANQGYDTRDDFQGIGLGSGVTDTPRGNVGRTAMLREKGEKLEKAMARTQARSLARAARLTGRLREFAGQRRRLDRGLAGRLQAMEVEWSHAVEAKFKAFEVGGEHGRLAADLRAMHRAAADGRAREIRDKERRYAWHGRMLQNLAQYMGEQPFPRAMVEFLAGLRAVLFVAGDGTGADFTRELYFWLSLEVLRPEDHKHRGVQRMLRQVRKAADVSVHQYMDWLREQEIEVPAQVVQWSQGKHKQKKMLAKRRQRAARSALERSGGGGGGAGGAGAGLGAIGEEGDEEEVPAAPSGLDGLMPLPGGGGGPPGRRRSAGGSSHKRGSVVSTASSRRSGGGAARGTLHRNTSQMSSFSNTESDMSDGTDAYSTYTDDESVMESVFDA